jgi:sulfotransferase
VIHFISGLPRSGSTLLAAILRQNPRFHAGMSSPVASLFMALQGAMETKVICCVRHVPWIMDSIERLIRQNAFELSGIFGYESLNTVYTRVNRLATSEGLVGFALDALREAFWGEHANRLILVGYEALTKKPADTLKQLYEFLGEKWFAHDFDNVEFEANDFDIALGTPNLHTVRRKVEWTERATLLPPELFNRFVNDAFWTVPGLNTHNVPVILHRD